MTIQSKYLAYGVMSREEEIAYNYGKKRGCEFGEDSTLKELVAIKYDLPLIYGKKWTKEHSEAIDLLFKEYNKRKGL